MSFDLVLEFIETASHVFISTRRLYPESVFKLRLKYGILVPISSHPWISSYISESLMDIKSALAGTGEISIDLALLRNDSIHEKLRFVFDAHWGSISKEGLGEDVYYEGLVREFRGFISKMIQVLSSHGDEETMNDVTERSFIFHFHSKNENELPHWITVQEPVSLFEEEKSKALLPIRKITKPYKFEIFSEIYS
eukprot:TRINITY_DN25365_c0_g1_i1.p1 TRINITY_DN25365_c0_g1~~TRINITY_DN25365_c0_g1_i1.p1  ORF type:complete len:195 (+),score=32.00 TRINITY_DN25365_c0_g1_i1:132-716(+)